MSWSNNDHFNGAQSETERERAMERKRKILSKMSQRWHHSFLYWEFGAYYRNCNDHFRWKLDKTKNISPEMRCPTEMRKSVEFGFEISRELDFVDGQQNKTPTIKIARIQINLHSNKNWKFIINPVFQLASCNRQY